MADAWFGGRVVTVSDDDWFERALRDDSEEADDAEDVGEPHDEEHDHDAAEDDHPDESGGMSAAGDESGSNAEPGRDDLDDGPTQAESNNGPFGGDEGGTPFDEDFASALQDAPDPDAGSGQPPGTGGAPEAQGGGDPFGGSAQDPGGSPFGGGQDADPPPFGGGGDGEFGFGGDEPGSFEEAELESDLERLDIGIDGLDQMILGGVPRRSLMVAIGSAGTGKTTFGLQFLNHGLQQGQNAVYITLEESYDRIISTADEKGWGFGEYVDDDRLAVVDIDPIEMANSLDSIQNDLPNLIEEFGADRLVLDSVSLLEMMYESAPRRRSQVFGFARALKQAGITTLLTSEADQNHAYASRFGIVEYLADAVFVLQYVRPSDFQETRLAIEIQKIRDANHSRETKPYDLTAEGISVYRQANIF